MQNASYYIYSIVKLPQDSVCVWCCCSAYINAFYNVTVEPSNVCYMRWHVGGTRPLCKHHLYICACFCAVMNAIMRARGAAYRIRVYMPYISWWCSWLVGIITIIMEHTSDGVVDAHWCAKLMRCKRMEYGDNMRITCAYSDRDAETYQPSVI